MCLYLRIYEGGKIEPIGLSLIPSSILGASAIAMLNNELSFLTNITSVYLEVVPQLNSSWDQNLKH